MNLKIGDVVALKSGGPDMTVENIDEQGNVTCTWFEKDGNLKTWTFKEEMLDKCEGSIYSAINMP
jgi:uncharacterized protein YodC (DUF2158 family)